MLRRFSLLKWPGGGYSIHIDRIRQMLHTTVLLRETCRAARTSWHAAFTEERGDSFLFAHYLATMNRVLQEQFRWKRMFNFSGLCTLWNPGALNQNSVSVEQPVSDCAAKLFPRSWSPCCYDSRLAGKIQTKWMFIFSWSLMAVARTTKRRKEKSCVRECVADSWPRAQRSKRFPWWTCSYVYKKCHPTTCRIAQAEYARRFNELDRAGGAYSSRGGSTVLYGTCRPALTVLCNLAVNAVLL